MRRLGLCPVLSRLCVCREDTSTWLPASQMRFVLTVAFRPLFIFIGRDLTLRDATFVTAAGLRGSVSLIMSQAVVTATSLSSSDYLVGSAASTALPPAASPVACDVLRVCPSPGLDVVRRAAPDHVLPGALRAQVVKCQIVFWTCGYVLLTLLLQAPLLPWCLKVLKLNTIPEKQLLRRQRAIKALEEHTGTRGKQGMVQLQGSLWRGVDLRIAAGPLIKFRLLAEQSLTRVLTTRPCR